MALIKIDLSEASWVCRFCLQRCDITTDMIEPLRHKAQHCVLYPEAELADAQRAYREVTRWGKVQRLMGAHLMKHPEDANARFDPASVPSWATN